MVEAYRQSWLRTFDRKTRMDRNTYLKAMLMHALIGFLPAALLLFLEVENVLAGICSLFFTLSLFPIIGSTIQRLHDVGKSGWNLLLYWFLGIFVIGWILLGLQIKKESAPGENKWGNCPVPTGVVSDSESEAGSPSFVDERLTQKEVEADRKKLIKTIFKIIVIYVLIITAIMLLMQIETYVAPYV